MGHALVWGLPLVVAGGWAASYRWTAFLLTWQEHVTPRLHHRTSEPRSTGDDLLPRYYTAASAGGGVALAVFEPAAMNPEGPAWHTRFRRYGPNGREIHVTPSGEVIDMGRAPRTALGVALQYQIPDTPFYYDDQPRAGFAAVRALRRDRIEGDGRVLVTNVTLGVAFPWWAAFAATAIAPALRVRRRVRRRRRKRRGLCPRCGYDLRASPERCPECGQAEQAAPPRSGTRMQS